MLRIPVVSVAFVAVLASCGDDGPSGGGTNTDPEPDDLAQKGVCAAASGAGTDHTGPITANETWTESGSPHRIPSDLVIKATVTIEPCTVIRLAAGVRVSVGSASEPGRIVGHGTSEMVGGTLEVRPITFEANDAGSRWGQISVEAKGTLDLAVTAIQNGGATTSGEPGAVLVRGVAGGTNAGEVTRSAKLDAVLIERSASYGLNLDAWGGLDAGSRKLWIRSSGGTAAPSPIRIEPGVAGTLPADLVATGNMKDEIEVRTTKSFMRDDTFGAHGIPYHVTSTLFVNANADGAAVTLHVEPGVTIGFDAGANLLVGSSTTRQGLLAAPGTAAAPIVFTSARPQKAAGDWANITFRATPPTGNRLSYARIEYAGADSQAASNGCGPNDNDGALLILTGPPGEAFVDHSTFDQIAGTTVIVSGWVDDAGPNFSTGNTFGASTPSCKVSKPRRTGGGNVCDGGRDICWP